MKWILVRERAQGRERLGEGESKRTSKALCSMSIYPFPDLFFHYTSSTTSVINAINAISASTPYVINVINAINVINGNGL